MFVVREVIVNSERWKVSYIYSTEYQQLSFTVVLLLRVMALYLRHIIKHITVTIVIATTNVLGLLLLILLSLLFYFFFFLLALQPPLGVVFYSPLVGFSLLAYEVS